MDVDGNKGVFQRFRPSGDTKNHKVCFHWRAGKCNRFPCPFLHRELPAPHSNNNNNGASSAKRSHGFSDDHNSIRRSPNFNGTSTWGRVRGGASGNRVVTKTEKICNYWSQGTCSYGDKCRYLHSWCTGDFSLLTQLEGHQKVVTGITMPSGSDKLYTVSKDETIRLWDCQSGQCSAVINLGGEVGCMLNEGPWIFVGLPNMVKAWNIQTNAESILGGPVGQVYALVVGNDMLFSGTQDGTILAWRFNAAANNFEPVASLKGHNLAVVTLIVGANRLYSGSMDHSIRVWSLDNLQCVQTLADHKSVVMSILCWDQFLLSCSLDNTIKVWAATGSGNLEVTYTHNEEHVCVVCVFFLKKATLQTQFKEKEMGKERKRRKGKSLNNMQEGMLTLCGMHDLEGKPVLLCSGNDNTTRAYDLPSFSERGKIFSKQEIRSIQIGPGGLFFTGDGTGLVKVWNWSSSQTSA